MVETATARGIFTAPAHPYTRKLMRATPRPGVSLRDLLPEEDGAAAPAPPSPSCRWRTRKPLLVVEKLVKEYPRKGARRSRRRDEQADAPRAGAGAGRVPRGRRHQLHRQPRRERRPGRQIRLRQVHHLDHGDAADRQDRRHHHVRRRGHRRNSGQGVRQAADAPAHPDGVPGSDRQPQSALHRGARHRRSDPAAGRHQAAATPSARAARNWRARSGCRSSCSTAFRISFPAARRRASASRARSRSSPISSSSTSRPRRSTCRCRRWCSICCRT